MKTFALATLVLLGTVPSFAAPVTYLVCGPSKGFTVNFKKDGKGSKISYFQTLQVEGEAGERNLNCGKVGGKQRGADFYTQTICKNSTRKGFLVKITSGGFAGRTSATVYDSAKQKTLTEGMLCK